MQLQFLKTIYSICQLPADAKIPNWALQEFLAIIRTADELTLIVPTPNAPQDVKAQHDYACFRVSGELDFSIVGVIAAISAILAQAKIPILSVSTYNTDYFLVSQSNQEPARLALASAGYEIQS